MNNYKIIILSHGEPREIVQKCDSFLDAVSHAYKCAKRIKCEEDVEAEVVSVRRQK